ILVNRGLCIVPPDREGCTRGRSERNRRRKPRRSGNGQIAVPAKEPCCVCRVLGVLIPFQCSVFLPLCPVLASETARRQQYFEMVSPILGHVPRGLECRDVLSRFTHPVREHAFGSLD